MNEAVISGILIAVITAVVTSALNYGVHILILRHNRIRELRKERLTKLLLPLYIELQRGKIMWKVELSMDNGDPVSFIEKLPLFYSDLEMILKKYLYLADEELSKKSLKFIEWLNVDRYDKRRFDKILLNGIEDLDLKSFEECVLRKYKHEQKHFT